MNVRGDVYCDFDFLCEFLIFSQNVRDFFK